MNKILLDFFAEEKKVTNFARFFSSAKKSSKNFRVKLFKGSKLKVPIK